jgi:hypothetical protein
MAEAPSKEEPRETRGLRRHFAGMVALIALFVAVAAWFWMSKQGASSSAGLELPHGVIAAGATTFIVAMIAEIRAMSLGEILEAAWELLVAGLAVIGAVLKAFGAWLLGLLFWN